MAESPVLAEQLQVYVANKASFDQYVADNLDRWLDQCVNPTEQQLAALDAGPGQVFNPVDLTWHGNNEGMDQNPATLLYYANNFPTRFSKGYETVRAYNLERISKDFADGLEVEETIWRGDSFEKEKKSRPAFARAEILVPDLIQEVRIAMTEAFSEHTGNVEEARSLLFTAYHCLARLVDINDPYVLKSGVVDTWYLCR